MYSLPNRSANVMKWGYDSDRVFYIYLKKNLRAYPGTIRGTEEWDFTDKVQGIINIVRVMFAQNRLEIIVFVETLSPFLLGFLTAWTRYFH